MKLILVRHGETDANKEGRVQGVSDSPLTAVGLAQAKAVAQALRGRQYEIDAIYSSPLSRALETAGAVAQVYSMSVTIEERLRELDVGALDGLTGPQLREMYPGFMERWMQNVYGLQMPHGESIVELERRAWEAVLDIMKRHHDGRVVAVSHNFAIQSILCKALDLPLDSFRKVRMDLGAISILELDGGYPILVSLNERCHWPGEQGP